MNEGRLASAKGIDAPQHEFDDLFEESQVPHSNAMHARVRGRGPYFCGPLSRLNLNLDHLDHDAASAARDSGVAWPNSNPYTSIVARAVEVMYAAGEAVRIIDRYEAPRGVLYHLYETDARG